jgi:hypothetical protein
MLRAFLGYRDADGHFAASSEEVEPKVEFLEGSTSTMAAKQAQKVMIAT